MKKILVLSVIASAVILAGCGDKKTEFNVTDLGNELVTSISYDDELSPLDIDTARMLLNLSDINIVDSAIYEGSGATAEEIIVLKCSSEGDVTKAKNMMDERVAEQKESFEDYVPQELPKLDSAVIKTSGTYAVLSVSGDSAGAEKIIEKYLN